MKRKIFILAAVFLLLLVLGGIYFFNASFLPSKIQEIIHNAEPLIHRKIRLGDIEYTLAEGLVIKDLVISGKDDPQDILFKAAKISCKIPMMPLLKKKTLILPHIMVHGFSTTLARIDEETWNISDLFHLPPAGSGQDFQILMGKITLDQGDITLADLVSNSQPVVLAAAHIEAGFSLPQKINFSLNAGLKTGSASAKISGTYFLKPAGLELDAQVAEIDLIRHVQPFLSRNLPLSQALIHQAKISLTWEKGWLNVKGDIQSDAAGQGETWNLSGDMAATTFDFTNQDGSLTLAIKQLNSSQADFVLEPHLAFQGNLQAEAINFSQSADGLSLSGNLTTTPVNLTWGDYSSAETLIALTNIQIKQNEEDGFSMTASVNAEEFTVNQSRLHLTGNLTIPELKISRQDTLTASLPLYLTDATVRYQNRDMYVFQGNVTAESLDISQEETLLKINTVFTSDPMSFEIPGDKNGQIAATVRAFLRKDRRDPEPGYSVGIQFHRGKITNPLPDIARIDEIRGDVEILPQRILFTNLLCRLGQTDVLINGDLRGFEKLAAELSVSTRNIDIRQWLPLIQKYVDTRGIDVDGRTDLIINITGPLAPPARPSFWCEAGIKSARVNIPEIDQPFTDIAGNMTYKEDFVSWDNLTFRFKDEPYSSSGSLKKFAAPSFSFKIQSGDMTAFLSAEFIGGIYTVSRADLKTKLSALSATGKFTPDKNRPFTEFRANGQVTLSDLERFFPLLKEKFEQWKVHGRGNVAIAYTGIANNPVDAQFSITYQSPDTFFKNMRFQNLTLTSTQNAPYENSFDGKADFYGGKISATGNVTLRDTFPLKLQARVEGIDLNSLSGSLDIKRQIAGICSANVFLSGPVKKTSEITGQGAIRVEQGHFEKSNFLKGVLALILNKQYQDTVFTDAKAKLFIRANQLRLKDIYLRSDVVTLTGFGWIDIAQNIDFTISPNFKQSGSIKPSLLEAKAENIVEKYTSIRVTGTFPSPKHSLNIDPGSVIQDAADMISDGVQNLFQGMGL